jgi:uncharacterized protein (TIGR00251 family)
LADEAPRWFRRDADHFVLAIHAQPGARRTEVAGLHGDALKIRVGAPAVDGKANAALIAFVSDRLGIPKRDVTLAGGELSREKKLRVPAACDPRRLVS